MPHMIRCRDGQLHRIAELLSQRTHTCCTTTHIVGFCGQRLWSTNVGFDVPLYKAREYLAQNSACRICHESLLPERAGD